MNKQQIVYIDVNKIHPHPKNPRKKLGDLSELTESIKAVGILQNLTVVPKPDGPEGHYYVVIGHRRHAGAKKAALKEVPCIISDMDEKEQVRTMMVENIQRSDLTVYEEARGFQMMLDMGDTVAEISERTGFSNSTVRHRVKLLELDSDKFQKSVKRGANLQDFMALEKIKDPELKNKVLDSIGTPNFYYELKRTIEQEKEDEKKAAVIKELETFAKQIEQSETNGLKQIQWISLCGKINVEKPVDAGQRDYFFTVSTYNFTIYAEPTEQEEVEDTAQRIEQQKQDERRNQLEKLADRVFQLRSEFIKELTGTKKKIMLISEMAIQSMFLTGYQYRFNDILFRELLDIKKGSEMSIDLISEFIKADPERLLLIAAYCNSGDSPRNNYHDWCMAYKKNEDLDRLYDILERIGYEMSDEEKAYQNGTHKLFAKSDDDLEGND